MNLVQLESQFVTGGGTNDGGAVWQYGATFTKKENARRVFKEIGLSFYGLCSEEQSQPRDNDLNPGI